MNLTVALAILLLCAVFFVVAVLLSKRPNWGAGAQILQGFVTSVALALAGYFYFIERRGQPHADVTQSVQAIRLPHRNVDVETSVTVKNLGNQLLKINHLRSRLQVIDLGRLDLSALATTNEPYWNATDVLGNAFEETELQWPNIRLYDGHVDHEIEPGESDLITVTFLIPCQAARYVRVATDVEKWPAPEQAQSGQAKVPWFKKPVNWWNSLFRQSRKPMAWKARSLVDLSPVCAKGKVK